MHYGLTGSYRIPYICGGVLMFVGLVLYLTICKPGFVRMEEAKAYATSVRENTYTTKKSNKNPSFYLKKPEKEKQIIPTGKKTMGKKKNNFIELKKGQ